MPEAEPEDYIDIVFDGPPGPVAGRFIEVENADGRSIRVGEWIEDAPFWRLRIPMVTDVGTKASS